MTTAQRNAIAAIKKLLKTKSIDKITVTEIIEEAGISRQAFYNLYQDKYDLAFSIYELDIGEHLVDDFLKNGKFWDMIKQMYTAFYENADLYKKLFQAQKGQIKFRNWYEQFSNKCWYDIIGKRRLNHELEMVVDVYSCGTCSLVEKWVLEGMKTDIDVMVDISKRTLPPELREFCE